MLRGNRKQIIFRDDRDRLQLNNLVAKSLERYESEIHAFCWMSNHLHLLVRVNEAPVHRTVHYFAMMYAKYFNLRHGLVGHLFQGRYKSRYVGSDGYFLQLLRYIHRNPVEAGLVGQVEDYQWSSMQAYLGHSCIDWLTTTCGLSYFSGSSARLLQFVRVQVETFEPWETVDGQNSRDLDQSYDCPAPSWRTLDDLLAVASVRFDVSLAELQSAETKRHLTRARCWIGNEAIRGNLASLSEVARLLNRSPAALSKSIRRNAARVEKVKG